MALTHQVERIGPRSAVLMFLAGMLAIWAAAGALAMIFGLVDLGPAIDS
ncbi:hypothetical protein OIE68_04565 [Nocardia vinacea]|nr:hypothetical protein OIE68_04565 [Nocardia vinacea]